MAVRQLVIRRRKRFIWPLMLASLFATLGFLILGVIGWHWLTHEDARLTDILWDLEITWWMLSGIASLLTASAMHLLRSGSVRWLTPLQKCVILALLGHLILALLMHKAPIAKSPSEAPDSDLLVINVMTEQESEVGAAIRREIPKLPPQDQKPTIAEQSMIPLLAKLQAAAKPMELEAPRAEAKAKPWETLAPKAEVTPEPEKPADTPPKLEAKDPNVKDPTQPAPLAEQEKDPQLPEPKREKPSQLEAEKAAEPLKAELKPLPAKAEPANLDPAAKQDARTEAEKPVEVTANVTHKQLQASPEAPAKPAPAGEQKPTAPSPVASDAKLSQGAAGQAAPQQAQVPAQKADVAQTSITEAPKTDQRTPGAAQPTALAQPSVTGGQVAANPANVNAAFVQQSENQPGSASSAIRTDTKLGQADAGSVSPGGIEAPARPATPGATSLAPSADVQKPVAAAGEQISAPANLTAGQQVTTGLPDAQSASGSPVASSEVSPAGASWGGTAGQLGQPAVVVPARSGKVRIAAPTAQVKGGAMPLQAQTSQGAGTGRAGLAAVAETPGTGAPGANVTTPVQVPVGSVGQGRAPVAAGEANPAGARTGQVSAAGARFATGTLVSGQRQVGLSAAPAGGAGGASLAAAAAAPSGSGAGTGAVGEGVSAGPTQATVGGQLQAGGIKQGAPVSGGESQVPSAQGAGGGTRLAAVAGSGTGGPGQVAVPGTGALGGGGAGESLATAAAPGMPGGGAPGVVAPAIGPKVGSGTGGTPQVAVPGTGTGKVSIGEGTGQGGYVPGAPGAGAGKLEAGLPSGPSSNVSVAAPAAGGQGQQSIAALAAAGSPPGKGQAGGTAAEGQLPGGVLAPIGKVELSGPSGRGASVGGAEARPGGQGAAHAQQATSPGGSSHNVPGSLGSSGIAGPAQMGGSSSLAALAGGGGGDPAGKAGAEAVPEKPFVRPVLTIVKPDVKWLAHRAQDKQQLPGVTKESEQAVEWALAFLARAQEPDGRWTHFTGEPRPGRNRAYSRDTALTGLAALCFLAADHTPSKPGPYQKTITKAIDYLVSEQKQTGDLRSGGQMYDHAMAALALAEAAVMTGDAGYRAAAIKAAEFIISAQDPETGGWRYTPGQAGDTSVLGWQVMALYTISHLGVKIPDDTRKNALRWLDYVSSRTPNKALAGYVNNDPSPAMSAEAAFARILLGQQLSEAQQKELSDYLLSFPPGQKKDNVWRRDNFYLWYYTALALMQFQNEAWRTWNVQMSDYLVKIQCKEGELQGSWEPNTLYSGMGGRIYSTALATLTLEVYYRYLPIFARPHGLIQPNK